MRLSSVSALSAAEGKVPVREAVRATLDALREKITSGRLDAAGVDTAVRGIAPTVRQYLSKESAASLRPVINATGVLLHTNLGRAPLSEAALQHIAETARGYCNLEFDLASGERGKRDVHAQKPFDKLLQPYAGKRYEVQTVVVNNCAAAVLLTLNA